MSNFSCASQKADIVKALLDGKELSILTGFRMFSCSNIPREIGRAIIHPETGFGALIIKKKIDFTSTYGKNGFYFTYKLDRSPKNKEAIKKMRDYIALSGIKPNKKIVQEVKAKYVAQQLFPL